MPGLTCNACNMEFKDEEERNLHYKSDWHRYNLKRKVAGVPGVTEALFEARQSALAQEKNKSNEAPMLYTCAICAKGYRSSKAHEQHLQSRSHVLRVSQGTSINGEEDIAIIRQLPRRVQHRGSIDDDSEDEWVEVDSDEELAAEEASDSLSKLNVNESGSAEDMDDDGDADKYELDPTCCLMCDKKHKTLESCMLHMHKHHGFFIPDIEYLKDPEGLLTYLGLKVKRDFMCLYCNELCRPFSSLEAVRKHMEAKSHCKLHYGDGDDEEDAELEEFYDYSSSYVDEAGKQIVVSGETDNTVELVGGSELLITEKSENTTTSKTLGSREFMRYYRQKPRPTSQDSNQIIASLSSRYKSLGLKTVPSKEETLRMKVRKEMSKRGETMRTKIGVKSNVIRNLPNNVPY
ncbi:Cytoplasmic 60S subunit biogenesis factor REI1 1 [Arabidopsis thaliana]|uniref:Cytoplasmic 60S subunit biogenesis factor REI1 homolog 1 n=4 Tax=Arabidopsis TaxID=3701 RepID=REIL1_ARATH|nr:Zinc finger protein 622 [Arabidopsis thaliana]Q8H1G5.1 RecName: Full=Cytoplasmic 60S subunit biogenesis factor REI1 homolog 1; AltName: Full=Protein REI1-LIKE 1; AltName: Full=pre-60S factor REI1 homolog 1 [Arabidopsis thaliana]KAG7618022.1 Zinc finger C2H2 superfamily [Arabidopsis thaliana x Arabidopsis arenosa]KAG7622486.1 Zinc finger C2H2 superfamily [Arabidopsis suecica]AAN12920.1 putative zinc finger protein [Arabidopsis thaliana]AEE85908.1 Zinc finger protein 622 [Arabidopsis thaliana|eukprot:NP_567875.1 Zinc finger protein 622 [Arabidopsis thaliana]